VGQDGDRRVLGQGTLEHLRARELTGAEPGAFGDPLELRGGELAVAPAAGVIQAGGFDARVHLDLAGGVMKGERMAAMKLTERGDGGPSRTRPSPIAARTPATISSL
jgi:hypothetical protein